jgi:hypothetical protein
MGCTAGAYKNVIGIPLTLLMWVKEGKPLVV